MSKRNPVPYEVFPRKSLAGPVYSKEATPEYRDGWERTFGRAAKRAEDAERKQRREERDNEPE
jgi:hypothetical protein